MPIMHKLRLFHATLAIFVLAAYCTGEAGLIHSWLGYGVAVVIMMRLLLALSGAPQLGLMRFYPHFSGLRLDHALTHPAISRTLLLCIALCLVAALASGIALDRGKALGLAQAKLIPSALADEDEREAEEHAAPGKHGTENEENKEAGAGEEWEDFHEATANLLLLLVALHVTYVVTFKRPLARFMVFAKTDMRKPTATS